MRLYDTANGERTLAKVGSKLPQIQVKEHKANGQRRLNYLRHLIKNRKQQIVFTRCLCILN